jgi:DNA-binding MarR family transcriptional regulator
MSFGLPLGPALYRAAEWFNEAFAQRLVERGWPRLSRSQAQVLLHLDPGGVTAAELARRLEMTRQSVRELLAVMVHHGLVSLSPHPGDARSQLVHATDRAHRLGADAAIVQVEVDAILVDRVGAELVDALRAALAVDWGSPPVDG